MIINIKKNIRTILFLFVVSTPLIFLGFVVLEPSESNAVTDDFIVTQIVTGETSFSLAPADVSMSGSISGISGGTATGQTQFGVLTSNSAGYNVTLKSTSTPSMQGLTQGDEIDDYTPASAGTPDFSWQQPPAAGAEFGYTISASTTADLDQSFKDDGAGDCGTGGNDTSGSSSCWLNASTTEKTILNRGSATGAGGENSTIYFQTEIMNNAFIVEDTYQATIVLTLTDN